MPINPIQKKSASLGGLLDFAKTAVGVVDGIAGLPGKISNAADKVGSLFGASDAALPDSTLAEAAPKAPEVGREAIPDEPPGNPMSAMGRRMENDPSAGLHAGIEALHDPKLGLSHEDGMAIFEPLLRAKMFGKGGGIS